MGKGDVRRQAADLHWESALPPAITEASPASARPERQRHQELWCFAGLLALLNLPLLGGSPAVSLMLLPGRVFDGEWWRLLTHPFIHVSWYHLLMDSAGFLLVYFGLVESSRTRRLGYVLATTVGSVLVTLWAAPMVWTTGLGGISAIAHGLSVVSGLEMIVGSRDRTLRVTGWVCFLGTVIKCGIETMLGSVLLASWHLGSVGTPVVCCHAGGVIGALVAWLVIARWKPRLQGT